MLSLHRIVEAREDMMHKAVAGLEFETRVFEQKIRAAAELAQRCDDMRLIETRLEIKLVVGTHKIKRQYFLGLSLTH